MRFGFGLVLFLVVAGCDDAGGIDEASAGGDQKLATAEQAEGERACAEMTGYAPKPAGSDLTPADERKRRQEEYLDCVTAVVGGKPPDLRGRSADPVSDPLP